MFTESKKTSKGENTNYGQNIISQGTKIAGDLFSEGDIRIDGIVEGNINTSGKIVVGKQGAITGTLVGTDAYFEGKFSGKLTLSGTLTLKSTASIEGEVIASKLAVEPGANFNVTCQMKGSLKEIKSSESKAQKTA